MVADLLSAEGLEKYRSADEAFFLKAAGEAVRDFCGWHIAPSETVVGLRIPVGQKGIIILPSLYVTAVQQVVVDGRVLTGPPGGEYDWETVGVITRTTPAWPRDPKAAVTFVHGYPELPESVAVIGYELAQRAMDTVGGNTKEFGAGPYRVSLASLGVELDKSQKNRLKEGGYWIPGVR